MPSDTQAGYDKLAEVYAKHLYNELAHKPFDRKMLDLLVDKTERQGIICDLGCGPGHVARYLHQRGSAVTGIDLSDGMVAQAQRLNPTITFQQGDMQAMVNVPEHAFSGIAAFYSIIHVPQENVLQALQEMRRVLLPQGTLLLSFHIGTEIRHIEELWGQPVSIDFIFYETADMKSWLQQAGFVLDEVIERDPYPEAVEVQTRRAYIFAHTVV